MKSKPQQQDADKVVPDFPPGAADRIGFLLNHPASAIRNMTEEALRPLGLIGPHMGILATLDAAGPQSQGVLGERQRIDRTTMVWLIDDLEKAKFVKREANPEDRRAYFVTIMPAGKKVLGSALGRIRKIEDRFLAPLTDKEQGDLKRLLIKLFEGMAAANISHGHRPGCSGRRFSRGLH